MPKEVLVLVGTVSVEAECLGFCDGKPSCLGVHIQPFPSAEYQVTGSNSFANEGTSIVLIIGISGLEDANAITQRTGDECRTYGIWYKYLHWRGDDESAS